MPSREKRFTEQVRFLHPTWEYRFWTDKNLPPMPEAIQRTFDMFGKKRDYAFQADVLRVFVVSEYGGVYLDVDLEPRAGLLALALEDKTGFFCRHGDDDFTIPNTAFGASRGSRVIQHLRADIRPDYDWYGPSWMGDTVKRLYGAPREYSHSLLAAQLQSDNTDYVSWSAFHNKHFYHHALYSWCEENRSKLERGLIP